MSDHPLDHGAPPPRLGVARIAIGFLTGLVIWALQEASEQKVWPATQPALFGALVAAALLTPFVLLGGLGALRGRTLAIWAGVVATVFALLGWHDISRGFTDAQSPWISPLLMAFGAVGLFIAHHLVAGADAERKPIARYPRYFEIASKHGVQLALSVAFVGAFWIVLFLGGALFGLIGIKAVNELLQKEWFAIPATATMFAAAVHVTDVRPGLIRGIRTLGLTLLSWLLPILAVLGAAFLLALPFTGLEPLWKTRSATGILLSAAAVLIVLINAAYQDGEPDGIVPLVLRVTTRLAAVLLAPLVALAAYAIWLRIGQHGLTPDRVVGIACAVVAAVYAIGYLVAAVRPGRWMLRLEVTNIAAAFVVLAVLLAIFSPLADPARLSVNDQMARLAAGKVTAAKFDYDFLRWNAGRYGREALEALRRKGGEAGRKAAEAQIRKERRGPDAPPALAAGDMPVISPAGTTLPPAFFDQAWDDQEAISCGRGGDCKAFLIDLNRDGVQEVVVSNGFRLWAHGVEDGRWRLVGDGDYYSGRNRGPEIFGSPSSGPLSIEEALKKGAVTAGPSPLDDLIIDGQRVRLDPEPAKAGD